MKHPHLPFAVVLAALLLLPLLLPLQRATLASRNNLAHTLLLREKFPKAEVEYRALNGFFERAFGPDHW